MGWNYLYVRILLKAKVRTYKILNLFYIYDSKNSKDLSLLHYISTSLSIVCTGEAAPLPQIR